MQGYKCYICSIVFSNKQNLTRHLRENRCKGELLTNLTKLNNILSKIELNHTAQTSPSSDRINISGNNNHIEQMIDNSVNINVNLTVNPISKLSLEHIKPEVMRRLVEEYDKDSTKLNLLLSDYVKNVLCDHSHPENQSVKYIKKKPPTYNSVTEDLH